MRVLGAVLTVAAALAGCDAGPDDAVNDAILVRHDMQPDPMDMAPADTLQDMVADGAPDPEPDMRPVPDMAPPDADVVPLGPCAAPDAVLPGEQGLVDRAWRVLLSDIATEARLSPVCGDGMADATGGYELKVRVLPDTTGQYLVAATGRFSASYRATVCTDDEAPEIDGCETAAAPFDAGTDRTERIDAEAGEAFDLVFDAPPRRRAGPLRVVVYPPVPENGSCAPIVDETRPSCVGEAACINDVCRYVGPPRADVVRAWSDGQSLRLEAEFSGTDLLGALWVRSDDNGGFVQASVTTAIGAEGGLIQGFIEDLTLADSGQIEVEMLDGLGRRGRGHAAVDVLEQLPADAACDPDGLRDVCSPGDACIGGRCEPTVLGAWIHDDALNLDVLMPGAPPGAELNAVIRERDAAPEVRWSPLTDRPVELGRRWTAVGLHALPAGYQLRIQPSGRPPGLPIAVEPRVQSVQGDGDLCDLDALANRCAQGLACRPDGPDGRCVVVEPPRIDELQGWVAEDAVGMKVTYRDPENDADRFRFQVLDRHGDEHFTTDEPLRIPGPGQGFFVFSTDVRLDPRNEYELRLVLIDATGMESEPERTALEEPPRVGLHAACDPLGAWAACQDDDTICAALDPAVGPRCERFERTCPERWPDPLVLHLGEDAQIQHDDDTTGGPDNTAGLCGGDDTVEAIYVLEASQDARWRVSTRNPDSVLYVRTHCAFAVADESELDCNNDTIEFDVERDETYYIFVDGPEQGGEFTLFIDELVRMDGPAPVEPID